jgi:hypothetical protein
VRIAATQGRGVFRYELADPAAPGMTASDASGVSDHLDRASGAPSPSPPAAAAVIDRADQGEGHGGGRRATRRIESDVVAGGNDLQRDRDGQVDGRVGEIGRRRAPPF